MLLLLSFLFILTMQYLTDMSTTVIIFVPITSSLKIMVIRVMTYLL